MVSHKYKCIFVHIPKAAGTSIGSKLELYKKEDYGMQDHRTLKLFKPIDAAFLAKLYEKEHAYVFYRKFRDRLERRPFISQEQYKSYFKFTFVRNPWARVHSWYKNVLDDPNHQKTFGVAPDASLNWFVKNCLHTVEPQLEFIRDWDGSIPLDFIGRYENLVEDFNKLCEILGIEDRSLPEKTRVGAPSYSAAFDQESIDTVAKAFQEEIDYFNFVFGEESGGVKENKAASEL